MPISEYLRNIRAKIGHDYVFMPGVAAVVFNHEGKILLQRSRDSGLWGIIGGTPDPGEPPAEAAVREIYEETSVRARVDRLVGVFTEVHTHYPNGDIVQYVGIVFVCHAVEGEPRINDDESHAVGFYDPNTLPDDLLARHRFYIELAIQNRREAYYFFDGKMNQ
ncbi:MAG: NUDIX domain-containing protein [Anaerolineae bacterium]|nr:NUDIX domain-containing protein [Anaerolineae bacterium]